MSIKYVVFPLLLAVAACSTQSENPVSDARVRLPAVEGRPGAAYFTLHGGPTGRTLVSIQTEDAGRAEMHDMSMSGGMMTMAPITAGVVVPKNGEVRFAPGGKHVMLFDMKAGLKAGDPIMLNFRFADGKIEQVEASAQAPGGDDEHGH